MLVSTTVARLEFSCKPCAKTRGEIDEYEKDKTRGEAGFEHRGHYFLVHESTFHFAQQKFCRCSGIVWYVLTWRDYSTFVPTTECHLLRVSMAMGDESGMRTMLSEHQLVEEFGPPQGISLTISPLQKHPRPLPRRTRLPRKWCRGTTQVQKQRAMI